MRTRLRGERELVVAEEPCERSRYLGFAVICESPWGGARNSVTFSLMIAFIQGVEWTSSDPQLRSNLSGIDTSMESLLPSTEIELYI